MENRLQILERQVKEMRRQLAFVAHWHDTVRSPLYKRVWWWLQGYRFSALGTWYRARWNASARKYE